MLPFQPLHALLDSVLLTATGCGLSMVDLHDHLNLHRASFYDKASTNRQLVKDVVACTGGIQRDGISI